MNVRARIGWLIPMFCLLAIPAFPGSFEDSVRARWRGAWIVTEIETFSTCAGNYFNNDVSGQYVASRRGRSFEPGELAKIDKVQVNRKQIELMVTIAGENLSERQAGPFTLYDSRRCQIELEIAVPRETIKAKNTAEVDRILSNIAQRFATREDAYDSSAWNGREADALPADYDRTLARHAVWVVEESNATVDFQLGQALAIANELAREVDGNPVYLAGFAHGARMMREWRERRCPQLVGSTVVNFRHSVPDEHDGNTSWRDGFFDGQALVYNLAILDRLPACFQDVPDLPTEYQDDAIAHL